jgi:RND family efflux transporter MFP subunit
MTIRFLNKLAASAAIALLATAAIAAEPPTVPAISKPSEELKLSFQSPGIVKEVPVNEGDHVTAGQLLAKQDDREDQQAYNSMKLEADSTAKIDYSGVDRDVKQVALGRKQKLREQHNASDSEVEEAKLAVDLASTQIELAKLEHQQKGFDARKQEIKLELMKLTSPVDGLIQKINIGPGEMADPQNREGAIVVVKNDPLWVEMNIDTAQAIQLQLGQTLDVREESEQAWQKAKIIFFAPHADAASGTELVRLELPNPTGQKSGLHMQVKLPEKIAAASAGSN